MVFPRPSGGIGGSRIAALAWLALKEGMRHRNGSCFQGVCQETNVFFLTDTIKNLQ